MLNNGNVSEKKKRPCNLDLGYKSDSEVLAYSYKSSLSPRFEGSEMMTFEEGRRTSLPGKSKGRVVTKSIILRPEELFTKHNFNLKSSGEKEKETPPLKSPVTPGNGDSEFPLKNPTNSPEEINNNAMLSKKLSFESLLEPKSPKSPVKSPGDREESPKKDFVKAQASKRLDDRFNEWVTKEKTLETLATDVLEILKGGGEEIIKRLTDENSLLEMAKARATSSMKSLTPNRYRPPLSPAPDLFSFFRSRSPLPEKSNSDISIRPKSQASKSPNLVQTPPFKEQLQSSTIFQWNIPKFYFPQGKPLEDLAIKEKMDSLKGIIDKYSGGSFDKEFPLLLKALEIPFYWRRPFWEALKFNTIDKKAFFDFYSKFILECRDDASKFLRILANKRAKNQVVSNLKLIPEDFKPLMEDLIMTHPGLRFLKECSEFHYRYMSTVVSRIFYKVNRGWNGEINLSELRESNLLEMIKKLGENDDINIIYDYFSYEHFYVIYCKFWELDKNHDEFLSMQDLIPYGGQVLSHLILKRIFSGTVHRSQDIFGTSHLKGHMSYTDFVWFIMSEEDKKSRTAIEYWFRCLDLNGDGIISAYELDLFYAEQRARLDDEGVQALEFDNIYCQAVDQLGSSSLGITLRDLKRHPTMASNIFNTMFNFEKYIEQEQRDPFSSHGHGMEGDDQPSTDWDRFCVREYEYLIAEESPCSGSFEQFEFEDPYNSSFVELAIGRELQGSGPLVIVQSLPTSEKTSPQPKTSQSQQYKQPVTSTQKQKKKKK